MSEPAIRVSGLGKKYRITHGEQRSGYRTLRDTLVETVTTPFRKRATKEDFWALTDVSFEVQPGEVVGIIGRNGAGKSTLLKILSRITKPTTGRVELNGRVGSLLEVGTGFHPELTGRENVYLNGSILGMSRTEVKKKFDEIVAFAEVEKFLDTPVKRYSSGMYVRLAFAVAAHLEPEILIVDEVLAVGDQVFQQRCLRKMRDVAGVGRTVIVVSHTMPVVQRLCTRVVLMNAGRLVADGPAPAVIEQYLATQTTRTLVFGQTIDLRGADRWGGTGEARVEAVTMYDPADRSRSGTFLGGAVGFRLRLGGATTVVRAVGLSIRDDSERKLVNVNTLEQVESVTIGHAGEFELEVTGLNLRPGRYHVEYWLGAGETQHIDVVVGCTILEVLPGPRSTWLSKYDGAFICPFTFRSPD